MQEKAVTVEAELVRNGNNGMKKEKLSAAAGED